MCQAEGPGHLGPRILTRRQFHHLISFKSCRYLTHPQEPWGNSLVFHEIYHLLLFVQSLSVGNERLFKECNKQRCYITFPTSNSVESRLEMDKLKARSLAKETIMIVQVNKGGNIG